MWSPNELLKIEKQRDILSYITLQFFHFKKVPLEHCPFSAAFLDCFKTCNPSQHSLRPRVSLTKGPFQTADRFYRWKGMTLCPLSIIVTL